MTVRRYILKTFKAEEMERSKKFGSSVFWQRFESYPSEDVARKHIGKLGDDMDFEIEEVTYEI